MIVDLRRRNEDILAHRAKMERERVAAARQRR